MNVWFIGRVQQWYVPASGTSKINDTADLNAIISVDTTTVVPGTSGAPLLSSAGVVGMIVSDDSSAAKALAIWHIEEAFKRWEYPWSLRMRQDIAAVSATGCPGLAPAASAGGTLVRGKATVLDGFRFYNCSGFEPSTASLVAWNSRRGSIQVSNVPNREAEASFFLPFDAEPYNDHDGAKAGIVEMKFADLGDIRECPETGYRYHWFKATRGRTYCVRSRDGDHYVKIKVVRIEEDRIEFEWVYQSSGARAF